jgi:hypothetical protein
LSLQQIKRDLDKLKESTDIGHLQELLKCNPDDLTDSDLCQLLMGVPVKQLPSNFFITTRKRWMETDGKSLSGVSTERLKEIIDELHNTHKECCE